LPVVGVKKRGPIGRAIVGDLPFVRPVRSHRENFRAGGLDQVLFEQRLILCHFVFGFWVECAIDDGLAIPGKKRTAVIAFLVGQSFHPAAIGIHRINIEVAAAHRGEDNFFPVG
jgi:hypothetical protein